MPLETPIATGRIALRPLQEADLDELVAGLDDWDVARFLARVPYPYRRADAGAFLRYATQAAAAGSDLTLVIHRAGKAIGCIGLNGIGAANEFGYWLARSEWGKGIATEAGRAFLAHAFVATGIAEIRSGVFTDNPASLRVQEKLGFVVVGASSRNSLARGHEVAHIDTVLSRKRFEEASA
jgi:RimJ/RimL family protein N-acetyltransferase